MFFYTHHRNKEAGHYVYADVSSYQISRGMFLYTHHMHTDAGQYVHTDVTLHHSGDLVPS